MANRTLTIIKPDSVRKKNFGKIISRIEAEGFTILGLKKVGLSKKQAEGFYAVHRERPFYRDLVKYMVSGPVYVAALERDDAVARLRQLMGATDPKKPDPGTTAAGSGGPLGQKATTGPDPTDTPRTETSFFFPERALM